MSHKQYGTVTELMNGNDFLAAIDNPDDKVLYLIHLTLSVSIFHLLYPL